MNRFAASILILSLASVAQADISDSGNLTIGGQGVIAGSMTVSGEQGLGVTYGITAGTITASSGTFTASGAAPYAVTSATGVFVATGRVKLAAGAWIEFADGTVITTTATLANAAAAVRNSTVTFTVQGSTTQVSSSPNWCPPLSTATITCGDNCRLLMAYQSYHQAGSRDFYIQFLVDGAFTPGWGGGAHAPCSTWDDGSSDANANCVILSQVLGSGTHRVCPALGTSGGGAYRNGQLSVVEVR